MPSYTCDEFSFVALTACGDALPWLPVFSPNDPQLYYSLVAMGVSHIPVYSPFGQPPYLTYQTLQIL